MCGGISRHKAQINAQAGHVTDSVTSAHQIASVITITLAAIAWLPQVQPDNPKTQTRKNHRQ